MQANDAKDTCGTSDSAACRLSDEPKDRSKDKERREPTGRQDQALTGMTSDAVAGGSSDGKQAVAGKAADATRSRDNQQPRDVAPAGAGHSAFAALSSSFPEFSTSAGSDAGSFMRQPRGVEAMMGGQRRTLSGVLTSPSGLSDHGSLLGERAASNASAHRALLGGVSPGGSVAAAAAAAAAAPAAATALLELPEQDEGPRNSSSSGAPAADSSCPGAELAPGGDAAQHHQGSRAAAAAADSRRPAGIARPTVVIPSPDIAAGCYVAVMPSPTSGLVHPFAGGSIPIDELDLDVIDDIPSMDACGLSSSSSPTISGAAAGGRSTPGHLRSSRDYDLRRMAVVNSMLSPSMQPSHAVAHITAAGGDLSISAEGAAAVLPAPAMFTGATRGRALPGSNNSLQSVVSGAEQYTSTDSSDILQLRHSLRVSRGNTPSPAPNGSPARPRSATALAATPRTATAGSSRASSAMGSPVPPPSQGPAAALLAGSVVASPRTPHSPLSVILSPRPNSARGASAHLTPLPGPLFGSGFGVPPAAGASPGTSPGTSSVAAPSSIASSCCTGSGAGVPVHPPAGAGGGRTRFASPSPIAGAAGDAQQLQLEGAQQQQQPHAQQQPMTQMQQLLRQQVMQHDTRYGPHGGSPLSPSHHQQLPPRGDALLSPSCPTPLVPPALTSAGSHNRQPADAAATGTVPASGAVPAGRTAGGVGQLSIHDWLDHQTWRLPYEVPQGLRDAADVRDAAVQEQQHAHSRMGPGRAHGSRSSSQRNSITNLDSPGALLLSPGAGSGLGRFPVAGIGHGAVPPPALQLHQQGWVHQQQQPGLAQQPAEVLLQRRLAAIQAAQAVNVSASSGHAALHQGTGQQHAEGLGDSIAWDRRAADAGAGGCFPQISFGVSGPLRDARALMQPGPLDGHAAGARPEAGMIWQQQQQQQAVAAAQASSCSVARGVSPLGQHAWPFGAHQQPGSNAATPRAGSTSGAGAGQAWEGHQGLGHCPADCPMAVAADALQCGQGGAYADRDTGCSTGSHVVQLGAGSHLYPAGSPVRHGSCCYSCQRSACPGQHSAHGCGSAGAHGAAAPAVGTCVDSSSNSSTVGRAGGQALCAVDVREYQQPAVPLVWRQLQSPLLSPTARLVPEATAATARQQAHADQHVLPGIAALLQRRHEQQQHQQPAQLGNRRPSAVAGSSRPSAATGSTRIEALQATQDRQLSESGRSVAAAAAAADCGSSGGSHMGCGVGDPGALISRHSSNDHAARAPGEAAAEPSCGGCSSSGGCSNVSVAALLCDKKYIGSVLSSLPGVDPQSSTVWEAVVELREALSSQGNAQGHEQPD